jgi:hypothetical protein
LTQLSELDQVIASKAVTTNKRNGWNNLMIEKEYLAALRSPDQSFKNQVQKLIPQS